MIISDFEHNRQTDDFDEYEDGCNYEEDDGCYSDPWREIDWRDAFDADADEWDVDDYEEFRESHGLG